MKLLRTLLFSLSALVLALPHLPAFGQASSFTYQGQLRQVGQPFTGMADLEFRLYDQLNGGNEIGSAQPRPGWPIEDGLFQVELDFGAAAFDGSERFIEVTVDGAPLVPRQQVTATPYAQSLRGLRAVPSTILFEGQPITANVIGGSFANEVDAGVRGATISGGGVPVGDSDPTYFFEEPNRATEHFSSIGGGYGNRAGNADADPTNAAFSTVGGGRDNTASGRKGTVGGGERNTASGANSMVGGGFDNEATSGNSTVAGGNANTASGNSSFVGGGSLNEASGNDSIVGGGSSNTASGIRSTVGGGQFNAASGASSAVGGGSFNEAAGNYSFVVGRRAKNTNASHDGVFMFADSQDADFVSSRANAFFVRARGGAEFRVDNSGLRAYSNATTINGAAVQARSENGNGIAIYGASTSSDSTLVLNNGGTGDIIRGFNGGSLRLQLQGDGDLVIGGSLTQNSDRNRKKDIDPIDVHAVLDALRNLPLFSWRYRHDRDAAQHIGPMAQDFHEAFGYGASPSGISVVDAQGVALAAIQALAQQNRELNARLAQLEVQQGGELAVLRSELQSLRQQIGQTSPAIPASSEQLAIATEVHQ